MDRLRLALASLGGFLTRWMATGRTRCRHRRPLQSQMDGGGLRIIANVGNHTRDLAGGDAGKQYLLPNYGFLD